MKKIVFFLLIFNFQFSIFNSAIAQWTQLVSGTANHLEEIFFPAPDTGYVVGEVGTILKTTDGTSWTPLTIGSNKNLRDVFFLDSQNGFVVGDSGLFAKTTNGGSNWSVQFLTNINEINFFSVCFTDANNGCVGGSENFSSGIIFKTADGGLSWNIANTPSFVFDINYKRIIFPTPDTGYALTRGFCMKTIDAGSNWALTDTFLFANGNMFSLLEDAYFFSPDTGYIVGWYSPFTGYTNNGGLNWSDYSLGQWFSIDFPSHQTGYIVGWGNLIKTTDGGATWNNITSSLIQNSGLYSMDFTDENTGYACGQYGVIIKTTNGGITSTNELHTQNDFVVYPNPASELLVIKNPILNGEKCEIEIFDVMGKKIYSTALATSKLTLQTSGFVSGMYFLKINSTKNILTEKIIIQK
ncbi:MAG: YCF48-related protein [Bacteroidia bacterium]